MVWLITCSSRLSNSLNKASDAPASLCGRKVFRRPGTGLTKGLGALLASSLSTASVFPEVLAYGRRGFLGSAGMSPGCWPAVPLGIAIDCRPLPRLCRVTVRTRQQEGGLMKRMVVIACSAVIFCCAVLDTVRGDMVVRYEDTENGLVFSWSGSLPFNATGYWGSTVDAGLYNGGGTWLQQMYAYNGFYKGESTNFSRTPGSISDYLFSETVSDYTGAVTPGSDTFGVGFQSASPGNIYVFLPRDYQADSQISGSVVFSGQTIASAGISDVTFGLLGLGGNVTFQAVPEPTAIHLALLGTLVAGSFVISSRVRRTPLRD